MSTVGEAEDDSFILDDILESLMFRKGCEIRLFSVRVCVWMMWLKWVKLMKRSGRKVDGRLRLVVGVGKKGTIKCMAFRFSCTVHVEKCIVLESRNSMQMERRTVSARDCRH